MRFKLIKEEICEPENELSVKLKVTPYGTLILQTDKKENILIIDTASRVYITPKGLDKGLVFNTQKE